MAELASTVHVADDTGAIHIFEPGDEVPEWAAEKITNPKAWVDEETDDDEESNDSGSSKTARKRRSSTPKD